MNFGGTGEHKILFANDIKHFYKEHSLLKRHSVSYIFKSLYLCNEFRVKNY